MGTAVDGYLVGNTSQTPPNDGEAIFSGAGVQAIHPGGGGGAFYHQLSLSRINFF